MKLTNALKSRIRTLRGLAPSFEDDATFKTEVGKALVSGEITADELATLTKDAGPTPDQVFGGKNGSAGGRPSTERPIGRHVKSGLPVLDQSGREVRLPSEDDTANAGAFLKSLAKRAGIDCITTTEDRDRLEACYRSPWAGKFGTGWTAGVPGATAKALLNDSLSGGSAAVPQFFDDALISFPLLYGELFPHVDLRNVPIGASIEGASVGNPDAVWGNPDGTEVALFDTADLVSEINTSIHPVTIAVEVSRDLLSDSPGELGRILTENCGQRLLAELDRVIALGDGTTEPEGLLNASGIGTVNTAEGVSGPPTVSDYESLLFALPKQYRSGPMRVCFLSNDTSYRRAKGIEVGTTDQRRVFGMEHENYLTLGRPHRIQTDIANGVAACVALAKYRMYRRLGFQIEWHMGGAELARRNVALLIVRGRFGGRLVDANAAAKWTDGEA
ncbi:MAG TPA: phage major capsid protein [Pirellulaceae bacterium]|nr:phage major capsid protein [Pirellulaceae bacterium]